MEARFFGRRDQGYLSGADGQNRTAVHGLRNHCFATKLHRRVSEKQKPVLLFSEPRSLHPFHFQMFVAKMATNIWSERGESNPRLKLGKLAYYHCTTLARKTHPNARPTSRYNLTYRTILALSTSGFKNASKSAFPIKI